MHSTTESKSNHYTTLFTNYHLKTYHTNQKNITQHTQVNNVKGHHSPFVALISAFVHCSFCGINISICPSLKFLLLDLQAWSSIVNDSDRV